MRFVHMRKDGTYYSRCNEQKILEKLYNFEEKDEPSPINSIKHIKTAYRGDLEDVFYDCPTCGKNFVTIPTVASVVERCNNCNQRIRVHLIRDPNWQNWEGVL